MNPSDSSAWQDQLSIRCVIERYTDAVNRQDWLALEPLFAESAVWETSGGPIELRFEGRAAVLAALQGMLTSLDFLLQNLSAIVVDVQGDRATARVSLSELGRDKAGQGLANHGLYFDHLARIDGEWRFLRRAFRFTYAEQPVVGGHKFTPLPPAAL